VNDVGETEGRAAAVDSEAAISRRCEERVARAAEGQEALNSRYVFINPFNY
jgi:hypothetical protein